MMIFFDEMTTPFIYSTESKLAFAAYNRPG